MSAEEGLSPGFTVKKKVDESWKESVEKEKKTSEPRSEKKEAAPQTGFTFFISTIGMQALMALGEAHDPGDPGPPAIDLNHAQYLIEVIQMLAEKTKGNLTKEEVSALNDLLYQLRIKFVEKAQGQAP